MRILGSLAEPVRRIASDGKTVTILVTDDANPDVHVAVTLNRHDLDALADHLGLVVENPAEPSATHSTAEPALARAG